MALQRNYTIDTRLIIAIIAVIVVTPVAQALLGDSRLTILIIAVTIAAAALLTPLVTTPRTPVESPDFGLVLTSFETRIKKLVDEAGELGPQRPRLIELVNQVNARLQSELPGHSGIDPPTNNMDMGEFKRILHKINMRLGLLEAGRLELPPSDEARKGLHQEFGRMTSEELADRRYLGIWGNYDTDARKSNWRVIEANRFIVRRRHEEDVSRDWWLAVVAIVVAFVMGAVATGAAVLAIPTERSLFCEFGINQWISSDIACSK